VDALALFSTITFSALDVEALESSAFELQFRSNFTAAVSAAAGVARYRVSGHWPLSPPKNLKSRHDGMC
jgi:hypothetical protein